MTWSIIARDPDSGAFGVAISTRFFAVGALCPYASGGIGALSTQALVNPTFGPRGLRLLAAGRSAAEVVAELIADDEGREHRQLHVIDRDGRTAAHTGSACIDWCGHLAGEAFSVAGNMLAGSRVVEATARAYRDNLRQGFAERLIRALEAGEAEGGDKRGKQSAALLIHSTEEYPELSLRVDDHPEPLVELRRLNEKSRERFVHFARFLPRRDAPAGIYDRAVIEAEIARATAKAEP
ncbi:MAG TPA: DUF1028 domain-containing protein [Alphaproteobacteria bacterium]|nr:DUF1028 domain-containing protein [Alphaproteobacteria bacterium]